MSSLAITSPIHLLSLLTHPLIFLSIDSTPAPRGQAQGFLTFFDPDKEEEKREKKAQKARKSTGGNINGSKVTFHLSLLPIYYVFPLYITLIWYQETYSYVFVCLHDCAYN